MLIIIFLTFLATKEQKKFNVLNINDEIDSFNLNNNEDLKEKTAKYHSDSKISKTNSILEKEILRNNSFPINDLDKKFEELDDLEYTNNKTGESFGGLKNSKCKKYFFIYFIYKLIIKSYKINS